MLNVILTIMGFASLLLNIFLVPLVFAMALDMADAGVASEGVCWAGGFVVVFAISLVETLLLRLPVIVIRYDRGPVRSYRWLELSIDRARSGGVRIFPVAFSLALPCLIVWLGYRAFVSEWMGLRTTVILYVAGTLGAMLGMRLCGHGPDCRDPVCPKCGYVLYYAQEHRCPECGRWFWMHELNMEQAEWTDGVLQPRHKEEVGPSLIAPSRDATPGRMRASEPDTIDE